MAACLIYGEDYLPPVPNSVIIGLQLGQRHQPTAVCIAEIEERGSDENPTSHFLIRHLERLAPGISYPQVLERLNELIIRLREHTEASPDLYVDATGRGRPIIDLFNQAQGLGWVRPVYFNHGDQRVFDQSTIWLGKAYLVSRLQVLLQTGRLHLPSTDDARQLAEELLDYEVEVDERANERYGAFSVGAKDDLVTALGLAVHKAPGRWRIL